MHIEGFDCEHPTIAGRSCAICATHYPHRARETVEIVVPDGYRDATEFMTDCGFERAYPYTMSSFDMRRPSKPDYTVALRVTVRRASWLERIHGAWWLLRGGYG